MSDSIKTAIKETLIEMIDRGEIEINVTVNEYRCSSDDHGNGCGPLDQVEVEAELVVSEEVREKVLWPK